MEPAGRRHSSGQTPEPSWSHEDVYSYSRQRPLIHTLRHTQPTGRKLESSRGSNSQKPLLLFLSIVFRAVTFSGCERSRSKVDVYVMCRCSLHSKTMTHRCDHVSRPLQRSCWPQTGWRCQRRDRKKDAKVLKCYWNTSPLLHPTHSLSILP